MTFFSGEAQPLVLDANVFINLDKVFPFEYRGEPWQDLGACLKSGRAISVDKVVDEVQTLPTFSDWCASHEGDFSPLSQEEVDERARITKDPILANHMPKSWGRSVETGRQQADLPLVARAKVRCGRLVTDDKDLRKACERLQVASLTLQDLCQEKGLPYGNALVKGLQSPTRPGGSGRRP